MEITKIAEETRRVSMTKEDVCNAINHYMSTHHQTGLVTDLDTVEFLEDGGLLFTVHADPLAGNQTIIGGNPGNTLRATPTPTAAGEVPTASDVQRMANGLPPRLK